jgi:hypothetical protein
MSSVTFKHGPIEITVTGLPETINPRAVGVDLWIASGFDDDPHEAFARHFKALGGLATFPDTTPTDRYSARHTVHGTLPDGTPSDHHSRLSLHAPESRTLTGCEAIAAALAAEEVSRP